MKGDAIKRGNVVHNLIEKTKAWKHPTPPAPPLTKVNVVPGDMIMIASSDDEPWAFVRMEAWPDFSGSVVHTVFRQACFLVTGVWTDKKFLPDVHAVKLLAYGVAKVKDNVMLSFTSDCRDREVHNGDVYITNSEVLRMKQAKIIYRAPRGD